MMKGDNRPLESVLTDYFHTASPSDSFARSLETRLAAAHADANRTIPQPRIRSIWLRLAVIGIIVALSLALGLIGPKRVWAAIQQFWQRYIPGIGLVEEAGARALAKPVAHTEAGVTFEVREFVATAEETRMTIAIRGLPPETNIDVDSVTGNWPDGRGLRLHIATFGRLWPSCTATDCQELEEEPPIYELGYVLGPLPADVRTARVTWKVAGLVPGSEWSDRWVLEIPLSLLAEAEDSTFDQLIYPLDSSLFVNHMTLTVTNVVQASDRTVLDVTWSVPGWEAVAQAAEISLVDDQGQHYVLLPGRVDLDEQSRDSIAISTESSDPHRYLHHERWQFEPVSPETRTLTLEIKSMYPRADAEGSFEFDLPPNPRSGDIVPVNQTFEIAGGILRVASVRFVSGTVVIDSRDAPPTSLNDQLLIEADLEVVEQPPAGRFDSVILETGWPGPYWKYADPPYSESAGIMVTRLVYDPDRIWSNHVRIHLGLVEVYQEGPWTLRWDIPGR
jgi:hypothetical protein